MYIYIYIHVYSYLCACQHRDDAEFLQYTQVAPAMYSSPELFTIARGMRTIGQVPCKFLVTSRKPSTGQQGCRVYSPPMRYMGILYNIPQAIFYLLKGDYKPASVYRVQG